MIRPTMVRATGFSTSTPTGKGLNIQLIDFEIVSGKSKGKDWQKIKCREMTFKYIKGHCLYFKACSLRSRQLHVN
jgi:hypothetical protein